MVAVLVLAFGDVRYWRSAGILGLYLLFVVVRSSQIDNCSNPDPSPLVQAQAADELSLSENLMQDRQADEGELSGDVIHLPRQAVDAETGGNC